MEISFTTDLSDGLETKIIVSKNNKGVYLKFRNVFNHEESQDLAKHFLDKEQLKDFIGALLHIQSKLTR